MKPAGKRVFMLFGLLTIGCVLGGCFVPVSEYGETPVYGDYGYVGPWYNGEVEVQGGYIVAPPHRHWEPEERGDHRNGRREEHRRPEEAAPGRRAPNRRIPSIPNHPRPERRREEIRH